MADKMSKGDRLQKIRTSRGDKKAAEIKKAVSEGVEITKIADAAGMDRLDIYRGMSDGKW